MSLDANGNIWNGGCIGGNVYVYDLQLGQWQDIGNAAGSRVNGVMADRNGNVWGAGSDPCRLVHIDAASRTFVNPSIPLPGCSQPWGVSIDVDGYVWVVDMGANMAFKVDPETYQVMLTVGGLINPYTYSDMTGAGLNLQVNPPG
jgi:streptogramin lyase